MDIPPENTRSRTLLASVGATPQIVTETLYALAAGRQKWWPARISLVTTQTARAIFTQGDSTRGILPLLGREGKLGALARALGMPLGDDSVTVTVPTLADGTAIRDIRSAAEVSAFADTLFGMIRNYTANPHSELHVSLAGGRKSMSFITGQIMSLLGRPQDQLSHVLVEPAALETRANFWWPGDGSPDGARAAVRLHGIPYLRVRAWLDMERLASDGRFATAVAHANQLLQANELTIDLAKGCMSVAGQQIALPAQELGTMALIAVVRRQGQGLQRLTGWNPANPKERGLGIGDDRARAAHLWAWLTAAADYSRLYRDDLRLSFQTFDRQVAELAHRFDYDQGFLPLVSRLRRRLRQQLSPRLAQRILPPRRLETTFAAEELRVLLPPELADHPERPSETAIA